MDHIGIDVDKKESQICILAERGELIEQRIRTEPERFATVLGERLRARIVIEAETDSEWVARCLEALDHEVVVADPNFGPMYATPTRKAKTDRRDARGLADACLLGAHRRAHRLSDSQRHVRGRLTVRDAFVRTRTRHVSLIWAFLRQHGSRVPSGSAEGFLPRVRAMPLPDRARPGRGPGGAPHPRPPSRTSPRWRCATPRSVRAASTSGRASRLPPSSSGLVSRGSACCPRAEPDVARRADPGLREPAASGAAGPPAPRV